MVILDRSAGGEADGRKRPFARAINWAVNRSSLAIAAVEPAELLS
jgi:hypothetical protein